MLDINVIQLVKVQGNLIQDSRSTNQFFYVSLTTKSIVQKNSKLHNL